MACELHAPRYIDLFRHHFEYEAQRFQGSGERAKTAFGRNREYIDRFLMELKDENEKLVQEIRANAEKEPQRPETQPEIPAQTPVLPEADESRDLPLHIEAMINEVEQEEDELNQKEQEASISYEEEALALYEKGLSPEEIARQLKSGKTEIELFLKFRGKLKNDS